MENPYAPSASASEMKSTKGPRPFGIKVLGVLFVALSILSTALAFAESQTSGFMVLACSILLVFLLRGVYLGREGDRKTGALLGFLIVLLNAYGLFDTSSDYTGVHQVMYVASAAAEGGFGLAASAYLMKLKGNRFFNN